MPFDPLPNLTQEQLNCLALADFIEESELFDMNSYGMPHCGTAGCIAGHAGTLFNLRETAYNSRWVDKEAAAEALGIRLDKLGTCKLFNPWRHSGPKWTEIDKHRAARVLRHFALTGEVDWSV